MPPTLLLHPLAISVPTTDVGLPSRGYGQLWSTPFRTAHPASGPILGASSVGIAVVLTTLVRRVRREFPSAPLLLVGLGLLLVAGGMTYLGVLWTLSQPIHWASGGGTLATAIASGTTMAAMPLMLPRIRATLRAVRAARAHARPVPPVAGLAAQLERTNAELRRVAAEAQRHLDELEATYRSAPVGLAVLDLQLRFVRINERLAAANGLAVEAHLGRTVREIVPDVADAAEPVLRRVLETGEPVLGLELTGETAADPGVEHVWVESWIPLRDAAGAIAGINVVAEDVTAQRHAEAARQVSEARYRALVESAPHLAWSSGLDGTIGLVNRRWAEYTGRSAGSFVGAHWDVVVHPEDRPRVAERREHAIAAGEPIELEVRFHRHDGAYRWHLARVVPVSDPDGRTLAWYGAAMDVDDQRREAAELARTVDELQHANARLERLAEDFRFANEELAEAHVQASAARVMAEQANAAKTQFLATMSHELRTPLNAVIGYVGLLELEAVGPLTAGQRGYLARVTASAQHLLGLIDEVLDLSKVEAGQMTVTLRPTPVHRETEAALALVRPQAEARGLALAHAATNAGGELRVAADPDRVRQILVNLLGNAVKFSAPGGRVTLAAQRAEAHVPPTLLGPGPWACLTVADTGVGIPADRLEAIFEPFVQFTGDERSTYARPHGGTGLGLAISRRFARLMGGELTVASEPGRGSTFTLWLPIALAERDAATRRPTTAGARTDLGHLLTAQAVEITDALVARLRVDPEIPYARRAARVDLEGHVATFLADLGQALTILDAPDGDRLTLFAYGTALRHLIVHQHGRQRARLGWTVSALRREFAMLREEVARAVGAAGLTLAHAPVEELDALIGVLLDEAERIAVAHFGRDAPGPDVPTSA